MDKRYFGTDGIRGRVGEFPITPDFMLKLGWSAGRVLAGRSASNQVLIGKDTRISNYMFESALQAGLSAAGVNIQLLGPMPTPAVAYLTRTLQANAGIVISASHNPHHDNGIKFFSTEGRKLDDATEFAIEAAMEQPLTTVASGRLGKAYRMIDATGRYIEFCKHAVPFGTRLDGFRLVIDCANGAGYQVAPAVFRELGAEVTCLGVMPDGLNINVDCGSLHPARLQQAVLDSGADAGIALDGDGDRVIMVDESGEVLDGDELLWIIAQDRHRQGMLRGPVVGTLMTNLGLELALATLGVPLLRARVGDRYVLEMLLEHQGALGGESSGHIICLDRTSTGDGIVSALQVLCSMSLSRQPISRLREGMTKLPQHMVSVPVGRRVDPYEVPAIAAAVREIEAELGKDGRVLLRSSGTEPVIRVMIEGLNHQCVQRLTDLLAVRVAEALVTDPAMAN